MKAKELADILMKNPDAVVLVHSPVIDEMVEVDNALDMVVHQHTKEKRDSPYEEKYGIDYYYEDDGYLKDKEPEQAIFISY